MDKSVLFEVKDLHVSIEGKKVLKGISLKIKSGEVHALMGRNGSGKTSLAHSLMGNPKYQIESGKIYFNGEDIAKLSPEERSRMRLFLGFQNPVEIPGVSVSNFLRSSVRAVRGNEIPSKEFRKYVKEELKNLEINESFMTRSLNEGFSGGERKRLETLQLRLLQPKMAILDETDSGLDIDALKSISENIEQMRSPDRSFLLITHYQRMLNYIKPDVVHVMINGKIIKTGDFELAKKLEEKGYEWLLSRVEAA